ncbi:aquaporin-11 [Sphaerodactylus townsendi]|uniref:aquaporin-11 n=1 Tax=Sphaerodactylus townsendi TaxID=933632 RepID=UPI0020275CDB|nr:aquaporin-11 [Sphaerodactylus townsendi]
MAAYDAAISLLVMVGTVALAAAGRQLARRFVRNPQLYSFIQELSGAFQICACTHELRLLADLPPKPQVALALTYACTAFHCLTLPSSVNNPASSFQLLCTNKSPVKTWGLQTSGQLAGAMLANLYMKWIWSLGIIPAHSTALSEKCNDPIQTTVGNAFILELLFSSLFHLTLRKFESMDHQAKVHLLALLVTALVYEGAHLTGAIFNPALAFSLHLNCFLDKFWNYILVYWIAPCVGSVLVAVLWDEVLPQLRRHFNI